MDDAAPKNVTRRTEECEPIVSRQAVTKHLHALADAGIVHSTRHGREQIWAIRVKRLAEVRRYLDQISEQWDEALDRLRAAVERTGQ